MTLVPRMGKLLLAGLVSTMIAGCINEYGRHEPAFYGNGRGAGGGVYVGSFGGAVITENTGRERRYYRRYRGRECETNDAFGNRYRVSC